MTVDMEKNVLINHTSGKEYELKALGDVSGEKGGHPRVCWHVVWVCCSEPGG